MKTILLVDDEPQLLSVLSFILDLAGYRVLTADDGNIGLNALLEQPVDLVIMDLKMPGRSGIELMREAQARLERCPRAILMTGFSDFSPEDLKSFGIEAVVPKPFDMKEFESVVKSLLDRAEAMPAVS